jgi:hypothetical protein
MKRAVAASAIAPLCGENAKVASGRRPLFARMTRLERLVAFAAALCLLGEFRFSDGAGFILAIACVLWQWRARARTVAAAA